MEEKERYLARCDYEREKDRRRRVTPPVSSTFIALALPHLLPFRPPPPLPLTLSLSRALLLNTPSRRLCLSPFVPCHLILSVYPLPLPPNNPRSRCIQGRCYRQRTIQPSRHSPSLFHLFLHSACLSLFLFPCPSAVLFHSPPPPLSLFPSLCILLPLIWPIYLPARSIYTRISVDTRLAYVVQVKSPGTGRHG